MVIFRPRYCLASGWIGSGLPSWEPLVRVVWRIHSARAALAWHRGRVVGRAVGFELECESQRGGGVKAAAGAELDRVVGMEGEAAIDLWDRLLAAGKTKKMYYGFRFEPGPGGGELAASTCGG